MSTWVCIGSGPSLCQEDIEYVSHTSAGVAVTNNAWELAPFADVLHAADLRWWEHTDSGRKALKEYTGQKWTASSTCAKRNRLNRLHVMPGRGWSPDYGTAYSGGLSGYQLLQMVGWLGATKIILLGYDMQKTGGKSHFFGDHPEGFANCPNLEKQLYGFSVLADQCPVEIINCTRETALTCFPRARLDEVL